jgi:hypothetical protein
MKKSCIIFSLLSMLIVSPAFFENAYSEEQTMDSTITTNASSPPAIAPSSDSSPILTSPLEEKTELTTVVSSEQESQTSLWAIEDENDVKYDSDQTTLPKLTEDEVTKIRTLYEKGIAEGKVTRDLYSYEAFQENYQVNKTTYEEMKDIFPNYHSYDEWFAQIMNYGAFPDGEGHSPSETRREKRATKEQNANRFKRDLQKGDIIIVNSGGFGHAAIATSDNYILEMSGNNNPINWAITGISDNNHQLNKHNWLWGKPEQGFEGKRQIDRPIQIWRLPNKAMANKGASYADKTFWNSSGGYKKNRHIDYLLRTGTLNINPNYCSKMVFQAYWYGSGSASVVQSYASGLAFISPGALPNLFTKAYKPYKVGSY